MRMSEAQICHGYHTPETLAKMKGLTWNSPDCGRPVRRDGLCVLHLAQRDRHPGGIVAVGGYQW